MPIPRKAGYTFSMPCASPETNEMLLNEHLVARAEKLYATSFSSATVREAARTSQIIGVRVAEADEQKGSLTGRALHRRELRRCVQCSTKSRQAPSDQY